MKLFTGHLAIIVTTILANSASHCLGGIIVNAQWSAQARAINTNADGATATISKQQPSIAAYATAHETTPAYGTARSDVVVAGGTGFKPGQLSGAGGMIFHGDSYPGTQSPLRSVDVGGRGSASIEIRDIGEPTNLFIRVAAAGTGSISAAVNSSTRAIAMNGATRSVVPVVGSADLGFLMHGGVDGGFNWRYAGRGDAVFAFGLGYDPGSTPAFAYAPTWFGFDHEPFLDEANPGPTVWTTEHAGPEFAADRPAEIIASFLTSNFMLPVTSAGETIYIDPDIATGFDYVSSNIPFTSVFIPEGFQEDLEFELRFGGSSFGLTAGTQFDFTSYIAGGVSKFTIQGIDPTSGLTAEDHSRWITGLGFADTGATLVSMTPHTQSAIPEPSSLVLWSALGGMGLVAARRRKTVFCR